MLVRALLSSRPAVRLFSLSRSPLRCKHTYAHAQLTLAALTNSARLSIASLPSNIATSVFVRLLPVVFFGRSIRCKFPGSRVQLGWELPPFLACGTRRPFHRTVVPCDLRDVRPHPSRDPPRTPLPQRLLGADALHIQLRRDAFP